MDRTADRIDLETLPHLTSTEFRRQAKSGRAPDTFTVGRTCEQWSQQPLIVTAAVTEPTVVRRPNCRSNSKPMMLLVPALDAITYPLLVAYTHCYSHEFIVFDKATGDPAGAVTPRTDQLGPVPAYTYNIKTGVRSA